MITKTPYKIVRTLAELDTLIEYCKITKYCCSDFETTGLKYFQEWEHPTVLGVSFQPGSAWIIPLYHDESPFKNTYKKVLRKFGREVIENRDITKIAWNLKFEAKWFMRYGIFYFGRRFDAMLAKYLLDEERPHGLKETVDKYLPEFSGYALKGNDKDRWKKYTLDELAQYCAIDCHTTFMLWLFFEPKLMKIGNFYQIFRNLLMSAVSVLSESEYKGMLINRGYLEGLVDKYGKLIADLKVSLYSMKAVKKYNHYSIQQKCDDYIEELEDRLETEDLSARQIANIENKIKAIQIKKPTTNKEQKLFETLNFASPKQLEDFLFISKHGLRLPILKKTDSGSASTDEETITKLIPQDKQGFIELLLELRGLEKLYSTYIVSILGELPENDRLHTTYLIHGTTTGRLSSSGPNLQNVPRVTTNADIKVMFVPPPGFMLLEMDYSQAELRVVAELSKDKSMIEMFKSGHNIHVATAARMAKMPYEELYPMTKDENHPMHDWATKMKKKSKTYNFGILYGQGPQKLAETIAAATKTKPNIPEAEEGIKDWFSAFPGVKKWISRQEKTAKKMGYVKSIFGRKRRLHAIDSGKQFLVAEALRQAVNTPIQSAASDFTLLSSIIIREHCMKGTLPSYMRPQAYTVHDSIGFYVKPEDIHWIAPKLVEIASNPETMKWFGFKMKYVNMKVSVEGGKSWGEYHDYDPKVDYVQLINK